MKAFNVDYECPRGSGYDTVICKSKELARAIMEIRTRYSGERLTTKISETSLDRIRIKDLTAADLLRLIKGE
jgi:hypothetical protein